MAKISFFSTRSFMKKIFILGVCILLCLGMVACVGEGRTAENDKYVLVVDFCGENMVCEQSTTVNNRYKEGLDSLKFTLTPNVYREDAPVKGYVVQPSSFGGIEIKEVKVNGTAVEWTYCEDKCHMDIPTQPTPIGEKIAVDVKYEVSLPEGNFRLGRKDGYINAGYFYPQLAVYEGENFREDKYSRIGDPVVSGVADFDVTLKVDEKMVVAMPGNVTESISEGVKTVKSVEKNMRDFAFCMNENFVLTTAEKYGHVVKYYSVGECEDIDLACEAVRTFSENLGEYPYVNYVVVESDFLSDGMEYSGLSVISKDSENKDRAILHETAHQWFYNILGSDNVKSPYLDESMATFFAEYYYLLNGEEEKFLEGMKDIEDGYFTYERLQRLRGDKGMLSGSKSIYDYTEYSYAMLVYNKMAMMVNSLYTTVGKKKFDQGIKDYVANNRFSTVTAETMKKDLSVSFKCDVSGLIEGWLGESVTTGVFG